jgi:hypothetical protein
MLKPYRAIILLAIISLLTACGGESDTGGFTQYTAEQVLQAFDAAELDVQNARRSLEVAPNMPSTFNNRYVFEISTIAPGGGAIMTFNNAANMQAWTDYIESQRANSATRRDYINVYTHGNVLLQISADLLSTQANAYRDALEGLD